MNIFEGGRSIGLFHHDGFTLEHSRIPEIERVSEALIHNPVVFLWAPSGNGKTGFGREYVEANPESLFFANPKILLETKIGEEEKTVIVDEFDMPTIDSLSLLSHIEENIQVGRKFTFLVHRPKNTYVQWQKAHQARIQHIIDLIAKHPDAPWIYLQKNKGKV